MKRHAGRLFPCRCIREIQSKIGLKVKSVRNKKRISSIVAIILAVLVIAVCFFINLGSSWMGHPANLGQLIATGFFIVFWSGFVFVSRRGEALRKAALIISLLVCISSVCGCVFRLTEDGFLLLIVAILTSILSSSLFYGFSYFAKLKVLNGIKVLGHWTIVDIIAVAISILWLVFAIRNIVQANRKKKMRGNMYGRVK